MSSQHKPLIAPLYEGTFSVGLDKKFIRIGRDDKPHKGALKISINPFLIKTEDRNILFDAGLGDFGEDTSTDIIRKNLAEYGLVELDITDIFTSHLHYDHLGGLAGRSNGYLDLTFPEAKLWVNRNEWEKLLKQDGATDDETKIDFIHFLDAKADIHFLKEEERPYPDVRVKQVGGHTEFSQVLFYESDPHNYMMAGDVIASKMSVLKKYAAKFDFDPEKGMKVREHLKRKAFEKGYVIMAYHESGSPLFKLDRHDPVRGYIVENAG